MARGRLSCGIRWARHDGPPVTDWLLLLLVPAVLVLNALIRRHLRRVENPPSDDSPTGYTVELVNRLDSTVFVDCLDGHTRLGRDLAPGQGAILLDSRRFGRFRPTWRVKVYPSLHRRNGGPIYPGLPGGRLDLDIVHRTQPGTQAVRIVLAPEGAQVDGPAGTHPAAV